MQEELATVIDQEFPPKSNPDPIEHDAALHAAFARSRTRVYIGRAEYFKRLDDYFLSVQKGPGPGFVILGESGMGKSALLANWVLSRFGLLASNRSSADVFVLHFIGASPRSSESTAMLRRIIAELKRRFDIPDEIPDTPVEIRAAFANALQLASSQAGPQNRRILLVLDALNQLDDRDAAPDLVWLPILIPENVRVIVSTLPGRALEQLKEREWPSLTIDSLTSDERIRFIRAHLRQYTKQLP